MKQPNQTVWLSLLLLGAVSVALPVHGNEDSEVVQMDPFMVIGSKEQVSFVAGAGYVLDSEEIGVHAYDNIDQVLRRVPGVYFRTEDGYGLFPNISFRGVGSMRTTQLTVMEDGVLSAPAPYSAPAAYYTPTSGRMSGLEVLKGSSQVRYGPSNTGGVLNYLSTPIPQEARGRVSLTVGENADWRFHGWYGDNFATELGTVGILFEYYHRATDGFKSIDSSPTYSGGDTGFTRNEPMLKVSFSPAGGPAQKFELKVGYTDMEADETYLGLSSEDFAADPTRRYVSTQFDKIPTEHFRSYLRHWIDVSSDTKIATTVYYNKFTRAWYKLNDVRSLSGATVNLSAALAGAPFYSGNNIVPGTEGQPLAVLRGEAAGVWRVRDNNREYVSYGAETIVQQRLNIAQSTHNFEFGVRLHQDYEDRFQKQDDYTVDANGNVTSVIFRQRGTQENRRGTAKALAMFLRDRMEWNRLTVTPGIRYERVRYEDERRGMNINDATFNQITSVRKGTIDVWAPGIGATYEINNHWSAFGGVHRGFSLPSPSSASAANPIREERSIGYEAGLRYNNNGGLRSEVVLFWTDFSDLIVPDNIGGAGTGRTENAGDVRTRGVEFALGYDPGYLYGWGFRNPWTLAYTYTDAVLRSDVNAGSASGGAVESIFAGGRKGNRLPYIPRHQVSLGTGIEFDSWGVFLDAFYVTSTWASANNDPAEVNPFGGPNRQPIEDARFGRNDAYFLMDVSAYYEVLPGIRLRVGAQNLLDREYVASRLPHGPRPGHPRFLYAGVTWEF